MSYGARGQARERILKRAGLAAGVLVVLALILLLSGHWILGIILAALAAAALWGFMQARTVR